MHTRIAVISGTLPSTPLYLSLWAIYRCVVVLFWTFYTNVWYHFQLLVIDYNTQVITQDQGRAEVTGDDIPPSPPPPSHILHYLYVSPTWAASTLRCTHTHPYTSYLSGPVHPHTPYSSPQCISTSHMYHSHHTITLSSDHAKMISLHRWFQGSLCENFCSLWPLKTRHNVFAVWYKAASSEHNLVIQLVRKCCTKFERATSNCAG